MTAPADLVLLDGEVITVDDAFSITQAVAISGDSIAAVGSTADVRAFIGPRTEVVDLRGRTALPGINDSHLHACAFGGSRPPLALDVGFPAVRSIADIAAAVREAAARTPGGEWIRGNGWDPGYLAECVDGRMPDRHDLDAAAPDHPVCRSVTLSASDGGRRYGHHVKLVVQVKLLPTAVQAEALSATLRACNEAATWLSRIAYEERVFSRAGLQKLAYTQVKARGLSAQPALHVIRKTADAYTSLRANIEAGNLGGPRSRRRRKATSKPICFRPDAAQPFDDRCLSWQLDARTVSIWTVRGRMQGVRFAGQPPQLKTLTEYRRGETDLIYRDRTWFLVATCDIPESETYEPVDWMGVDRGIVNLATTSDGDNYQGRGLTRYRRWQARKRAELQAKRTRSAIRRAKRRARREARHASHVNHKIAKTVVAVAQRTGRGVALEELSGIRDRVRLRRNQRATHSSWPFHQLGTYLEYKARRAGVPFLEVDPAYTSQTCPTAWCGYTSRANRPCRGDFRCRRCGFAGPADVVAGMNVARRARTAWVFVSAPDPAPTEPRGRGDAPRHGSQPRRRARQGVTGTSRKLGRSRPRS
jgi:putative transposase